MGDLQICIHALQQASNSLHITGMIAGLSRGEHGLHIYTFGDVSDQCAHIGPHYNPINASHGSSLAT